MNRARSLIARFILAMVSGLAGCASGTSHVESFLREVYPLDAAVAGGALLLLSLPDVGWRASVVQSGERRYRIAVVRWPWQGGGDGEFAARFNREAQRIAAEHTCNGVRVIAYEERYEMKTLFTNRIGEGEIECL